MAFKRIWHQAETLAALRAGATVVTSGERLARAVLLTYGEAQQAAGARVWERPEVVSYHGFIDRMYDAGVATILGSVETPPPKRLLPAAAEALWEEIIRSSRAGETLLQPAATAREAAKCWELCVAYRLPLEKIAASGEPDA